MTPHATLMAAIEAGVREALLPRVIESAANRHRNAQKIWADCDCQWCELKRTATFRIACVPYKWPPDPQGGYMSGYYERRAKRRELHQQYIHERQFVRD